MQSFHFDYKTGINGLREFVGATCAGPQKSHLTMTELGTPIINTQGKEPVYITTMEAFLTKSHDGEVTVFLPVRG